jgi:hypothetical protein
MQRLLRSTWAVVLAVLLALSSVPSPARAGPALPPFVVAYLSVVLQNSSWSTLPGTFVGSIVLQGVGSPTPGGSPVTLRFVRANGTTAHEFELLFGSPGNRLVYLPAFSTLPEGRYALVVLSRTPVLAQANLLDQGPTMAASPEGLGPAPPRAR